MKNFIFFNILLNILYFVFSVIPIWDFDASTTDLLSSSTSLTYTIYSETLGSTCNSNIELSKTITKTGSSITEENTLKIGTYTTTVSWEDIESIYCIDSQIYICPKGKNHMNKFDGTSNTIFLRC